MLGDVLVSLASVLCWVMYLLVWQVPYFLDWNARVLLVSSELLAGVVFEGAVYSFQPLGY